MRFALFALFALVGCTAGHADWYGDNRFTAEERAQIEEGARWLYARAGLPEPRISWDYEANGEPLPRTIRREAKPGGGGLCTALGGAVYLDVSTAYLDGLAAHELGHCALGLADDAETDGIMRVLSPMRWTVREANQWAGKAPHDGAPQ